MNGEIHGAPPTLPPPSPPPPSRPPAAERRPQRALTKVFSFRQREGLLSSGVFRAGPDSGGARGLRSGEKRGPRAITPPEAPLERCISPPLPRGGPPSPPSPPHALQSPSASPEVPRGSSSCRTGGACRGPGRGATAGGVEPPGGRAAPAGGRAGPGRPGRPGPAGGERHGEKPCGWFASSEHFGAAGAGAAAAAGRGGGPAGRRRRREQGAWRSRGPRPRRGLRALRGDEGLTTFMDAQARRWNLKGGLERGRAAARDALRRLAAVLALVLQVRPRRPVTPPPPPPRAPRIAFRRAPRRPPVFGPPVVAGACPCPRPHWTRRPSPPVASPRATDRPWVLRGARRPAATGARVGGARRETSRRRAGRGSGGAFQRRSPGLPGEGWLPGRGEAASSAGWGAAEAPQRPWPDPLGPLQPAAGPPPRPFRPPGPPEGHLRRRPRLRVEGGPRGEGVGLRCLPGRWAAVASFEKRPCGRTDRGGRRADPRCARVRSGW